MPAPGPADEGGRLRNLLTGRGRRSALRLAVAVVLAIPCGIFGFIAADLAAWVSGAGCTGDELLAGLGMVALVGVVAGGAPALVAGFRRIALLPFTIGSAGSVFMLVVLFFSSGRSPDCR
jgi:hypothetical protein